ncbi:uncharacterized protein LOC119736441 [Patiria miniata]|uniref:Fibrinogen C-terminal domain-containing protein n=1 Tax=Patiria miniata TaxID=46514 RepID=A0A914ARW2_PATMI|nr:uncharacterized protein LOC119736441 [Patiria miniata]
MTKFDAAFKGFSLILFLGMIIFVDGHKFHPHQQIMYAAENRALQGFEYATKNVQSRVICGRECSMDESCKSFNFNYCSKLCELNLATRREHPENFNATQGSVYFDADENTPHYSMTDGSLNRNRGCKMLLDAGYRSSGIYTIYPEGFGDSGLRVYCDMETDGGGWIVFQRRQDGSVDFYRNWTEYQSGFGDLSGEFWLGNDNLVTLTSDDSLGTWELRVDLEDWDGNTAWAKYSDFKISSGEYNLIIGKYYASSTAGDDSLRHHRGSPFSTKDRDNDRATYKCAQYFHGAWWFNVCLHSNLNGRYYPNKHVTAGDRGVHWYYWKGSSYSLRTCQMKMHSSTMAKLYAGLKVCNLMVLLEVVILVSGHQFHTRQQLMYAAENRALQGLAYATKTVRSRAICGVKCGMDERCKSFNFNDYSKMCETNLATRREHPEYFNATQGSVYFDADEDTSLCSLTDSSFNRYKSCKMLFDACFRSSGIYTVYPEGFGNGGLRVYCDMETDGGGWIVFQRRQDGSVDFYRNWTEYQSGFGDLSGEFWLGNDNLVTLTSDDSRGTWELRVDLGDWENNTAWAKYSDFQISPGEYNLTIGQYDTSSTAGDSLGYNRDYAADRFHRGQPFSTKDRDNDAVNHSCAQKNTGAWWFNRCFISHLNGPYYPQGQVGRAEGVQWERWKGYNYSLKKCSMKMRELGP